MKLDVLQRRASGVLLHPTSLPGRYGIGELGPEACTFVDQLANANQSLWSILPIGPTFRENYHCPYNSYSAFAGNPLIISVDSLCKAGLLRANELEEYGRRFSGKSATQVQFMAVDRAKDQVLHLAFERFRKSKRMAAFKAFCQEHASWLEDFAVFAALRKKLGVPRDQWPLSLRVKPGAREFARLTLDLADKIEFEKFCQYIFFSQWKALKAYANKRGVRIVGDLPIYTSNDSADVWAASRYFNLDKKTGKPRLVSGVPPDAFCKTGQLWNHPIYNWKSFEKDDFSWWIDRMRVLTSLVDYLRIDHFRGFSSYWAVPGGSKTAQHGKWYPCPGPALFRKMKRSFNPLPIVVEDLGVITPDVTKLKDDFGFMGMKVLQFAFDSANSLTRNPYAPFNVERDYVLYTGTHDNNTSRGFFNALSPALKKRVMEYMGISSAQQFTQAFMRLAAASAARWCIFPMQDILDLPQSARMNMPGVTESWKNWAWRMTDFNAVSGKYLQQITKTYERVLEK